MQQSRALGCMAPGPLALRSRAASLSVSLRCASRRSTFCPSARQGKKKPQQPPRAEQATSTATTEQAEQQQAESNGNGTVPVEGTQTENISHAFKSDLEVDSVLAKELGENGACTCAVLPSCFDTFLVGSAYSFITAGSKDRSISHPLLMLHVMHSFPHVSTL